MRSITHFLLVAVISLSAISCDKSGQCSEGNELTKAIITGYDLRKCSCCGGLMITFSSNPQPNIAAFNLIANDPSEFGINQQTQFPVYISVNYKKLDGCGDKVMITKFRL